jgi:hypothetical protein
MKREYMERVSRIMNGSLRPRVYIGNTVYAQQLVGRLAGRRVGKKVGTFPDPVPIFVQRIQRLKKIVKERGLRNLARRILAGAGRPTP